MEGVGELRNRAGILVKYLKFRLNNVYGKLVMTVCYWALTTDLLLMLWLVVARIRTSNKINFNKYFKR